MSHDQGNLKGESAVVAILPSRMEVSYCTSGFVRSKARQAILIKRELPFQHGLTSRSAWCKSAYGLSRGESRGNDNVRRLRQIRRYNNSPPYVAVNMAAAP